MLNHQLAFLHFLILSSTSESVMDSADSPSCCISGTANTVIKQLINICLGCIEFVFRGTSYNIFNLVESFTNLNM